MKTRFAIVFIAMSCLAIACSDAADSGGIIDDPSSKRQDDPASLPEVDGVYALESVSSGCERFFSREITLTQDESAITVHTTSLEITGTIRPNGVFALEGNHSGVDIACSGDVGNDRAHTRCLFSDEDDPARHLTCEAVYAQSTDGGEDPAPPVIDEPEEGDGLRYALTEVTETCERFFDPEVEVFQTGDALTVDTAYGDAMGTITAEGHFDIAASASGVSVRCEGTLHDNLAEAECVLSNSKGSLTCEVTYQRE